MIFLLKSSIQKLSQKENLKTKKTIFSSYLKFHNIKQEMNLEKVNRTVSKRKLKNQCKNYIFELFKILQYKTGNKFRKSHLYELLGEFLTFP